MRKTQLKSGKNIAEINTLHATGIIILRGRAGKVLVLVLVLVLANCRWSANQPATCYIRLCCMQRAVEIRVTPN